MTDGGKPIEVDPAIVKVEGVPKVSETPIVRRQMLKLKGLWKFLCKKIGKGGKLGEKSVRGKVVEVTNAAAKTASDAGELASRQEENEAKADLTRQESVSQFIENVEAISKLAETAQVLAIAKLIEKNPDLMEQFEKIEVLLTRLRLTKGLLFEPIDKGLPEPGTNEES